MSKKNPLTPAGIEPTMQKFITAKLLYMFRASIARPSRPSSGVHKTAVAASGTDHIIWGATSLDNMIV